MSAGPGAASIRWKGRIRQARGLHAHEAHHHRVHRRAVARRVLPHEPAVLERRLVAVVAVGDDERPPGEPGAHALDQPRVVRAPEVVHDPPAVVEGDQRRPGGRGDQRRLHRAVGVGVEGEDLAEVRLAGLEQPQPVGLRPAHRRLVGEGPAAELVERDARDEPEALEGASRPGVVLAVEVERVGRVLREHPARAPGAPGGRRARVAVDGAAVLLGAAEDQAHDVVRVAPVELLLLRGGDHVVGRRGDLRHVRHARRVVAHPSERQDSRHGR